jgi:hypothetical protein
MKSALVIPPGLRKITTLLLLGIAATALRAQEKPIAVADQTFKVNGTHEYLYALAEGDALELYVQLIAGRQLKSVEILQFPDFSLYRTYALDTLLQKTVVIPKTGVYLLRITENGLSKKICRFTLHRTPASAYTARMDTRVGWDIRQYPNWEVRQRSVPAGHRTEIARVTGQVTVPASKVALRKPVTSYQFSLPQHTTSWAYRIAVGQAAQDARSQDAVKLTQLLKSGAVKLMGVQPETALAAYALGMAVDMTASTAGEDVEYALLNGENQPRFLQYEKYDAFIWQGGISVDAQRRYTPLEGTWYFGFKNNNWVTDIDVFIDIEAVRTIPIVTEEIYLEPRLP